VTDREKWKDLVRQAKAQWAIVPVEEEEEEEEEEDDDDDDIARHRGVNHLLLISTAVMFRKCFPSVNR
jgi:DNA-directed RNA polymerase specialized sigma24 family protein